MSACAAGSAVTGPWYSHVQPISWQAALPPVFMASKYGMPCSLGTKATLTLPPPPPPPPLAEPPEAEPPLPWPQPEATRASASPTAAVRLVLRIILNLISWRGGGAPPEKARPRGGPRGGGARGP